MLPYSVDTVLNCVLMVLARDFMITFLLLLFRSVVFFSTLCVPSDLLPISCFYFNAMGTVVRVFAVRQTEDLPSIRLHFNFVHFFSPGCLFSTAVEQFDLHELK